MLHELAEFLALRLHGFQGPGALVDHEAEDAALDHAAGLEMPPDDDSAVVFDRFRNVREGDVEEGLPCDHRRAAGEEEEEGFAAKLAFRMRRGVEADRAQAVDDVFEMRGNGEVPDRGREDDAVGREERILQRAEIIVPRAGGGVMVEVEMLDVHVLDPKYRDLRARDLFDAFLERRRERRTVARVVGSGDQEEDVHGCGGWEYRTNLGDRRDQGHQGDR